MGVYINGVEMPKAQFQKSSTLYHVEGMIFVYPDGKARVELSVDYKERKSYPLVPVPPHGNLKDADAIRKDWLENYRYALTRSILDSFDNAPTIIEAEDDE